MLKKSYAFAALVALTVSVGIFVYRINKYTKESERLNQRVENIDRALSNKKTELTPLSPVIGSTNPLEKAYKQLVPLMDRQEAMNIMEKEYPKQQVEITINQYTREYAWRWTWDNAETAMPEKASLTIYFTRKDECVICRIKNAVYTFECGDKKERKSLRDNIKRI